MAKAEETKQNHAPASDLDDDIFAILNSNRPTYPGGGPNVQQPATKLNRSHVSNTQSAQRTVASHPTSTEKPVQRATASRPTSTKQPVQRTAASRSTSTDKPTQQAAASRPVSTEQPTQRTAASRPTSTDKPTQQAAASRPVSTEQPIQHTPIPNPKSSTEQADPWRPIIQPQPKREPLPRLQKRPIVSHAMPDQEDPVSSEVWPDIDTLEEIPEPEPKERIRLPKGRKMWAIVIAVYALILIGGFAARLIIHTVQNNKDKPDDSSLAANQSSLSDNRDPDAQQTNQNGNDTVNADIVSITPNTTYLAVLEDAAAPIKVSLSAHGAANSSHLIWTSSDEEIATVDETGTVKGIAPGTCTISVTAKNDPNVSAEIPVTVRHLEEQDGCTYVDDILIVNKTYSLPESYDPQGLTSETQKALNKMINDAQEAGLNLFDASDYRSYQDQLTVYQEYCVRDGWKEADTYSARPGHSEHQTGMVIDFNNISNEFDDTEEAKWLEEHCADYGFIIRFPQGKESITGYQYESWHVRYVGVEIAQEIQKLGICLEEYLGVDSEYKEEWPEDPCNPDAESNTF